MNDEHEMLADDTPRYLPVHVPRKKKLSRSDDDRIFLGLCGGIGERFNVEPTLVRILFILSILIGGWGLLLYVFAAMLIPKSSINTITNVKEQISIRRINSKILLGGTLMLVGFFFTFNIYGIIQYFTFVGIPPTTFWSFVIIGSGVFIFTRSAEYPQMIPCKSFQREQSNRRIAGVCGGLAFYLNVDTNMCRMLWIIFSFVTLGVGLVLYLILWLMLPQKELLNE